MQKSNRMDVKGRTYQKLAFFPNFSAAKEVARIILPSVSECNHITYVKDDEAWIRDKYGNLALTNVNEGEYGNATLTKLHNNVGEQIICGKHTVSLDHELIFVDCRQNCIKKVESDKSIITLFDTAKWKPISIFSSRINGDILIGMEDQENKRAKLMRFNKAGEGVNQMQHDSKGRLLYMHPHNITENRNGDVCTSDIRENSGCVVVVDIAGRFRFMYTGSSDFWVLSRFSPGGICTDDCGRIIVCDEYSHVVHMLDQDGVFLALLLTLPGCSKSVSLCIDDSHRLWCGYGNTITVYRYREIEKEK